MLPNLLTSFEIHKFYENKPKFNGVYSRNNLSKKKDVSPPASPGRPVKILFDHPSGTPI